MFLTYKYYSTFVSWVGAIAIPIFAWVVSFFMPIRSIIFLSLLLILVDLIIGVRAAKRKGHAITSKGLRRTVDKTLSYTLGIITLHAVDLYLLGLVNTSYSFGGKHVFALLVITVELKSISENIESLTGVGAWGYLRDKLEGLLPKKK